MSERTIDFDQYRKEKKEEPIIVKAFGQEFELPPQIPLKTMENIIELRQKLGKGGTIPEEQIFTALEQMISEDALKVLIEEGADVSDAEWLLREIFRQYRTSAEKQAEEETESEEGN